MNGWTSGAGHWRRRDFVRSVSMAALGAAAALPGTAAASRRVHPPVTALAFHPDGSRLFAGSQSGVTVLDPVTLEPRESLAVQMANVHDLAVDAHTGGLLVAGGYPGESGVLEKYRPAEYRPAEYRRTWSRETHRDVFTAISLSPDGRQLLAVSADGGCSVLDQQSRTRLGRFSGHSRSVLAGTFLPDGETVVTAGRDQTLRVWNAPSGKLVRSLHHHTGDVVALALRPQSGGSLPMVASASSDATVRLWQPTIGRMVRFARLDSPPLCVGWNAMGTRLVAGCRDGKARVIDPETVEVTRRREVSDGWLYSLAVHPVRGNSVRGNSVRGDSVRGDSVVFGTTDGRVRMAAV